MRIKSLFLYLFFLLLVGLMTGAVHLQASADESDGQVVQLSATGQGRAYAVTFSPNGKIVAVGSNFGIHLFRSPDLELLQFIPTDSTVRSLAFSPDGSMLTSGSYDNIVRLWRTSDGTLIKELSGHQGWVRSLAFSPDGSLLASASDDNTVRLWSMPDGVILLKLDQGMEGVPCLAFSPDGTILATGGFDNIIRFWQVPSGTLLRELKGHEGWVRTLAFSPNGEWLASGGFDATVRLWRVSDGELMITRKEHSSSILGMAFSPDGSLLASASVDTTVRLWKMPSLEPYDLLRGHGDFVYSVAFSPDGKFLISGAVDNTVHSWKVPDEKNPASDDRVSTPSNCKVCHHLRGNYPQPAGNSQPPPVPEVGCTSCHQGGTLIVNWCPAFPRSNKASASLNVSPVDSNTIGLSRGNPELSVVMSTPGNREYFLVPNVIAPLPLAGQVYASTGDPTDIVIQLDVWSGSEKIATLITQPQSNGTFHFNTVIGKHNTEIRMPIEQRTCMICHNENRDNRLIIPAGEIHFLVTAKEPNGTQAYDERWVSVDESHPAAVTVQVSLDGNDQPVAGLNVQASTVFYAWRDRIVNGITDAEGAAILPLDILSDTSTSYTIQIPPTLINGVQYESVEPVTITLQPGDAAVPAITLQVRSPGLNITGHVNGLQSPIQIMAVSLPDGVVHLTTTSDQGVFTFPNIPVGQYLITADPRMLADQGLTLQTELIDPSKSLTAELKMNPSLLEGASISGEITDEQGVPLPFAWLSAGAQTEQSDPASGIYTLYGLSSKEATITINAPGYYSQAHHINTITDAISGMDFRLVPQPETRIFPWGDGHIVIPPETIANVEGQQINFEQGWIWGAGQSGEPLVIQWDDMQITIPIGGFALQRLPAEAAWLYMFKGEATIRQGDAETPVTIQAGEMAYLDPKYKTQPSSYNPVAVRALQSDEIPELNPVWQPSLEAQIRDRLARAGTGTAQVMTFITYVMALLILCILPVVTVKWLINHKKEDKND